MGFLTLGLLDDAGGGLFPVVVVGGLESFFWPLDQAGGLYVVEGVGLGHAEGADVGGQLLRGSW